MTVPGEAASARNDRHFLLSLVRAFAAQYRFWHYGHGSTAGREQLDMGAGLGRI